MKIKLLLLISLSFFFSNKIFAQDDWILTGYSSSEKPYYVSSTMVEKEGEIITVWVKTTSRKKTISKKTRKVLYSNSENKILYEFDCSGKKLKIKYGITYNSKGESISSYKPEEYEQNWEYAVPGSVGSNLLDKVCELYNN